MGYIWGHLSHKQRIILPQPSQGSCTVALGFRVENISYHCAWMMTANSTSKISVHFSWHYIECKMIPIQNDLQIQNWLCKIYNCTLLSFQNQSIWPNSWLAYHWVYDLLDTSDYEQARVYCSKTSWNSNLWKIKYTWMMKHSKSYTLLAHK